MGSTEPCKIEYVCAKCGATCQLLNNEPNVCYECPNCRDQFHTEIDENGELTIVLGCN